MKPNIGNDGPPPIPAGGLPPGWSLEQWNHYGQQWLIQNPQPTVPTAPTPPTPSDQVMTQQFTSPVIVHPPMLMASNKKMNSNPGKIIAIIAIVGVLVVAIVVILAGVLYVWANSLDTSDTSLSANEIQGTWYNPVDTLTLYPNGTVSESTETVTQWRTNGSDLYILLQIDGEDIELRSIYEIILDDQGDFLLFIAFYQIESGNPTNEVDEASCIAYSSSVLGSEHEHFDTRKAIYPSWCNPDHSEDENSNDSDS